MILKCATFGKFHSKLFKSFAVNNVFKVANRSSSGKGGNPQMKVVIVGAAGRIGQPLALMLKQSPLVDELAIHDVSGTCGLGAELSHIDTKCKVNAYASQSSLPDALEGAKVVVLLAAAPGTSHRSFDDMFSPNASIVQEIGVEFAKTCPAALLAVVTEPINGLVPLISEVLKQQGAYNPNKIFGVTTLNVVRTNTFVGHLLGLEPECVSVPVLGGGSDVTIVPVLSQAKPCSDFSLAELQLLTNNIQSARQDLINVKRNEASILAAAFAVSRFTMSLIKGLLGKGDVIECSYVKSAVHPHAKYLSTPIQLGPGGIQRNLGLPELTDYEKCLLEAAIAELSKNIAKAEAFYNVKKAKVCDPCSPDPKAPPCPVDHCKQSR